MRGTISEEIKVCACVCVRVCACVRVRVCVSCLNRGLRTEGEAEAIFQHIYYVGSLRQYQCFPKRLNVSIDT